MLTRSQLLHNIENLLTSNGFKTSDIYDQGSFDLVARKNLQILLLKTFQACTVIPKAQAAMIQAKTSQEHGKACSVQG